LMREMRARRGRPCVWTPDFATEDAGATLAKISEAGGAVVVPTMDGLDIGRMAIAADPTGGAFGLWQARAFGGAQLANEHASFTWNELYTRDFERAKEFYRAVFGYTLSDLGGGMQYVTIDLDGSPVGGIRAMPEDAPAKTPSHWRVYFAVDDADQAVEHVSKLGGQVLKPAQDSPYGRWADVADGQGANFTLVKPPESAQG